MSDTYQGHVPSRAEIVVGMLGDAIRRWTDRLAFTRFMQSDPAEANRLAQDLNIDKRTLLDVVRNGHGSAALLSRRMRLLGIDADALGKREPAVVQDLSRCCSLCGSKPRCARDMVREPQGESWRTYCPNESTLDALRPAAAGEKAA